MKKLLYISADTNDGDYVSLKTPITEEELEKILPVIAVLKEKKEKNRGWASHNWVTLDCARSAQDYPENMYFGLLTPEQIEMFQEYVPYGQYGTHTIVEISIIEGLERLF